ncbi:MAG: ferritin family protein [Dehalococcoidales bacterium]|nr:ferritin family protein [Dehalococcoidales bacterium]
MAAQLSLRDVLGKAIQKEIEAQRLYIGLSQKVKDESAITAFKDLSRQELGHQNLLESYLRGEVKEGALDAGHAVDYKIAEQLDQPELSPDMKLGDVFLLAAGREKTAHDIYTSLSQIHPAGEAKKLLEKLAAQELEHKQRIESLYTEVAFPQTGGG